MSTAIDEWAAKFDTISKTTPPEGTILRAYNNEDVRLDINLEEGKDPFIYGTAYVPSIVGHELGWYLHAASCQKPRGYKCVLLPKDRDEAIRRKGIRGPISVKALRVIKYSHNRSAMLCGVAEWD